MRKFEKVICFLLALLMVIPLHAPVFAAAASAQIARVHGDDYESLALAIAAAGEGDTVELLEDTSEAAQVEIKNSITIDLGTHKVTGTKGLFLVKTVQDLTITIKNGTIETTGGNAIDIKGKTDLTLEDLTVTASGNYRALGISMRNSMGSRVNIRSGTYTGGAQWPLSSMDDDMIHLAEGVVLVSTNKSSLMTPNALCGTSYSCELDEGCFADVVFNEVGRTATIRKGEAPFLEGEHGYYTSLTAAIAAGETSVSMISDGGSEATKLDPVTIEEGTEITVKMNAQNSTLYYYGDIQVNGTLGVYGSGTEAGYLGDLTFGEHGTLAVPSGTWHYLIFKTDVKAYLPEGYGLTETEVLDGTYWYLDTAYIDGNDGHKYATIAAAIAAGATEITVTKNHAEDLYIDTATPIVIHLSGNTWYGATTGKKATLTISAQSDVTVDGGTIQSTRNYYQAQEYCVENAGKATFNNVTFKGVDAAATFGGGSSLSRNALIRSSNELHMDKCSVNNLLMLEPNGGGDGIESDGGIGVLVLDGTATLNDTYIYAGFNGVYAEGGLTTISGDQTQIVWAGNNVSPSVVEGRSVQALDAVSDDLIKVTGGKFNSNVSRFVDSGYIAVKDGDTDSDNCKVVKLDEGTAEGILTDSMRVLFVKDVHTDEGQRYQIILEAVGENSAIYNFKSATLSFELINTPGSAIKFYISDVPNVSVAQAGKSIVFTADTELSGSRIVLGTVLFEGIGTAEFKCNEAEACTVTATDFLTSGELTFTAADESHKLVLNPAQFSGETENLSTYGTVPVDIKTATVAAGASLEFEGTTYAADQGDIVYLTMDEEGNITVDGAATVTMDNLVYQSTDSFQLGTDGLTVKEGTVTVTFMEDAELQTSNGTVTGSKDASVVVGTDSIEAGEKTELTGDANDGYTARILYRITVEPADGIDIDIADSAAAGATVSFTVTPKAGWKIVSVKVSDAKVEGEYSFTMPAQDVTVTVVAEKIKYDVQLPSVEHGTVSASPKSATVGERVVLSVKAESGYTCESVHVYGDGDVEIPLTDNKDGTYSFEMPAGNIRVEVTFAAADYSITVNAEHGTVTPSAESANVGDIITLTVTPEQNYELTSLIITDDAGNTVTLDDQNSFVMPASNVQIDAVFVPVIYKITVNADHGKVTTGSKTAHIGDLITITITPDPYYEIASIAVVDDMGNAIQCGKDNTFTMPAANVTITVTFKQTAVTPEIPGIEHGSISLNPASATVGETVTVTVTPDVGYELDKLTITDSSGKEIPLTANEDGTYSFQFTDPNMKVTGSFRLRDFTVFVPSMVPNGAIKASAITAHYGDVVTVFAEAHVGYHLDEILITAMGGKVIELNKDDTFVMPASDVMISARFERNSIFIPRHAVFVSVVGGGRIALNTDYAYFGDYIEIVVRPKDGHELKSIKAVDHYGRELELKKTDKGYSLTMPDTLVTITAVFGPIIQPAESKPPEESTPPEASKPPEDDEKPSESKPPEEVELPFEDVASEAPYQEAIEYLWQNKMVVGTSETTFEPDRVTTRGEMVVMLHNMYGNPATTGLNPFFDVESGKYYTNAVLWAAENKVVAGYGNGLFGPEDTITREQLLTVFFNYAKQKYGIQPSEGYISATFTDEDAISSWAKDAVGWALSNRLITGNATNLFNPQEAVTRAEIAVFMYNFCQYEHLMK